MSTDASAKSHHIARLVRHALANVPVMYPIEFGSSCRNGAGQFVRLQQRL